MVDRSLVYNPPLIPYLDILYEDKDIMVVNKPSTILSVPGKQYKDSILSRVKSSFPDAFAVHRLDYGTSGVLVVGLHQKSISSLGKQFISREVHKVYVAWVAHKLEGCGAVNMPLIIDLEHRPLQKVDYEIGKRALTYYEAMYYDSEHDRTFVRLYPQTGRSHQLRVHMMSLGHPILGDHLYADDDAFVCVPHLYLHAALLSFKHPISGENMRFCAKAPFNLPPQCAIDESWLDVNLHEQISEVSGLELLDEEQEERAEKERQKKRAELKAKIMSKD